jgi:hypothetical protein
MLSLECLNLLLLGLPSHFKFHNVVLLLQQLVLELREIPEKSGP